MFNVYMDDVRPIPAGLVGKWVPIRKVEDVIYLLEKGWVFNLSLDHDMGAGEATGYDLVNWMERNDCWPHGTITIHSRNPVGAGNMRRALEANGK